MRRNGSQVHRLPDGSIDYGFYVSAAREERVAAIQKTPHVLVRLFRSAIDFWSIPPLGGVRKSYTR